jgi:hypothetical protein
MEFLYFVDDIYILGVTSSLETAIPGLGVYKTIHGIFYPLKLLITDI